MAAVEGAWRDPQGLGRVVRALQWGLFATGVLMFLTDFAVLVAGQGLPGATIETDPTATRFFLAVGANGLLTLLNFLVLLVAGVISLVWISRTNRNAQAWASGMRVSPGWAAGWFFVPFASLIKPFQGVVDTWRVSEDPAAWTSRPTPDLLRLWWALFLIDSIAGNLAGRLSVSAHTVSADLVVAAISLISDAAGSAGALVFWRLTRRLDDLQRAQHDRQAALATSFGSPL